MANQARLRYKNRFNCGDCLLPITLNRFCFFTSDRIMIESAQNEPMDYTIRQAIAVDIDLLDMIHTENMKGYVEKIYPWKPQLFRESFSCDDYKVIEINNRIIGFMKVVWSETEIYLAEIQIAQNYQKQGIGTSLIQLIIEKARKNNKKLWLKVLKSNPAKQLYQRLGFIKIEESLTHEIMAITP